MFLSLEHECKLTCHRYSQAIKIRIHLLILKSLRFILQLYETSHRELVLYDLPLVVLHTKSMISFHLCMLGVVCEFEWKATYFCSLRTKLNFAPRGMPKWDWPSKNRDIECSSFKPPHYYLQACTNNLTKQGMPCMQNNQLPTTSPVDNSSVKGSILLREILLMDSMESAFFNFFKSPLLKLN